MTEHEARALRPLWHLVSGAAIGVVGALLLFRPGPSTAHWLLIGLGCGALLGALRPGTRHLTWLWLAAGLALGVGRGLQARADRLSVEQLMAAASDPAVRALVRLDEGWRRSRWGLSTVARVLSAEHLGRPVPLPRRCRLEVRGEPDPGQMPEIGATVAGLVSLRGDAARPLLVASSARLLTCRAPPGGLARLRDRLAHRLLVAAGTDPDRIRGAELAAGLALGRSDLIPAARRDGWRRSGLAHVLAVSGLHVGLVAGSVWLLAVALGARPTAARLAVLVVLPSYALLAGASPSAVRAALMGAIYLAARLLGRALVPIAAVLLAALILILADPTLVVRAGFQLTVLITAALVRWVPPLVARLPGPRPLSAAIAVPVLAQVAAAPLTAWHFRTLVPGAALANLAVPLLLTPILGLSLSATLISVLSPAAAGLLLEGLHLCRDLLWWSAAPGRALRLTMPAMPVALAVLLVVTGWLALQAGRTARWGAAVFAALVLAAGGQAMVGRSPATGVALLPVSEGLAAVAADHHSAVLIDGGRSRDQAREILADIGLHRLDLVVATHPDEDHLGGLAEVLASTRIGALVIPAWLLDEDATVPLLRLARQRGAVVQPVSRGSVVRAGSWAVEVVWPPARAAPTDDNGRSLVARLLHGSGRVIVTADIDRTIEARLSRSSDLDCDVLLVPHHGSRRSTSPTLLDACRPVVALIPAGPHNPHHHPHPDVLARLQRRHIPFRSPAHDGLCGARPDRAGAWRPYP